MKYKQDGILIKGKNGHKVSNTHHNVDKIQPLTQ